MLSFPELSSFLKPVQDVLRPVQDVARSHPWLSSAAVIAPPLTTLIIIRYVHKLLNDPAPPRGTVCPTSLNYSDTARQVGVNDSSRGDLSSSDMMSITQRAKNFPPPYPNTWVFLCESKDLPLPSETQNNLTASVRSFQLCGLELIAFRAADGTVGVLSAFCTHQGVHLGCGGEVDGQGVRCPYHKWKFGTDGKLLNIPQIGADDPDGSQKECDRERNHLKAFEVKEAQGLIFFFYHADGEKSAERPPVERMQLSGEKLSSLTSSASEASLVSTKASSEALEKLGEEDPLEEAFLGPIGFYHMAKVGSLQMPKFAMHCMEPAHNTVDWYLE